MPTPGGGFTVGAAAGTLLVGLVFGRLGRVGPVITSMSDRAAQSLSALGMVTFLAYAGSTPDARSPRRSPRAPGGASSCSDWCSPPPPRPCCCSGCTSCADVVARDGRRARGSQTQPAILAYVNDKTGYDTRVGVAYALVYPVAMIVKIVVAQVLAGL